MTENNDKSIMLGLDVKSTLTNFNPEDFDPQSFINSLENNIQKINDFQDKGWLSRKFSDLSGENTKIIIESLDLNNQFIQLALWINLQLSINNNKIIDSQEELKKAQDRITENHEKIDVTDSKLDKAVETFNEISSDMKNIQDSMNDVRNEMADFNNLKNQINDQFSRVQKSIQKQIDKQSYSTSDFISTSQGRLDTFAQGIGTLTDKTEKELDVYKSELNQTKELLEKYLVTFNKKYTLFTIGLIVTSLLSLSAILLNILN